jgi:glycosyltransferase involved in cell wall biosynthesis
LGAGGIGRVGAEVRRRLLELGHEVYSLESPGEGLVPYFKYTLFDLARKIPHGMDVYHAITPMESIWLPKGKGVVCVFDIIALTHPGKYGGRWGFEGNRSMVTIHDLFTLTNPEAIGAGMGYSWLKKVIGRNYFKFACSQAVKCRYVIVVSEHVKRELLEYFDIDEDRVKVIKSGIREDLEPSPKPDGKFRLGYIGQLDKRKRVDLLIEAFKRSNLDELVIGGVGLDEAKLKVLAEGDSRIKFLGLVPDEGLADFYNSLDWFVFPTAIEGYGLPLVEAMACKKPAVVLEDAIIPDDVKDRCFVTDNLVEFFKQRPHADGLEDNYRFAKEHTWRGCVDQYIQLYEEVRMNEGGPRFSGKQALTKIQKQERAKKRKRRKRHTGR